MKKVLILCTGNSCRSIIAEALINANLEGIKAESSGVRSSGRVNPNAKKLLKEKGIWCNTYHSKTLDAVIENDYNLIVTVCDHAKETCPMFPKPIKTIHMSFEDPDGKGYNTFEKTYTAIEQMLLPAIEKVLKCFDDVAILNDNDLICYCMEVSKQTIAEAIQNGATTLKEVKEHTTACTGNTCKKKNPNKRCCSQEINQLIKQYSKGNIMNKNVLQTNNGVKISFTGAVEKQNIINMVQNCQNGQCECMSEETKQKITNMEVKGIDGDVALELSGNVSKEEIEAALAKSKVLNS